MIRYLIIEALTVQNKDVKSSNEETVILSE